MISNNHRTPIVFVISDSLGETAELVAKAAASQFNSGNHVEIRRIPYVNDVDHINEIVAEASSYQCVIAYTLVSAELRERLQRQARETGIETVDILGPMVDSIAKITDIPPRMEVGLLRKLDEQYFNRMEAIEFAVKYDDGKDPRGIVYADIVLIGISRTSKTPVSMYLAHKRVKAANIPLVPEVAPPEELFKIPIRKIVGLTIGPQLLNEIRQERLKSLGLAGTADYANLERILRELEYSEAIMRRLNCQVVDVTNRAVEETAGKILEIYYKGERHAR